MNLNRVSRLAEALADHHNLIIHGPDGGSSFDRNDFWSTAKSLVDKWGHDPQWLDDLETGLNDAWDNTEQVFAPATGTDESTETDDVCRPTDTPVKA